MRTVLFVCLHGAAKSVLAAADFERLARERGLGLRAVCAGTEPDPELSPHVVSGLLAEGVDLRGQRPRRVTRDDVLLDAQATKAEFERIVYGEFKEKMGSNDRLFVFWAGHGIMVKLPRGGEEGYLMPVDGDPKRPELTAIAMDEVRRMGKRVNAKHVFFAIDACFSGFALTRGIGVEATSDAELAAAMEEPVVQVLTAGRRGQKAVEEEGHGLFTRRLLDGLRGLADQERRGFVTVTQLAGWLAPRVARDSSGRQNPQYSALEGEGDFVFVLPEPAAPR